MKPDARPAEDHIRNAAEIIVSATDTNLVSPFLQVASGLEPEHLAKVVAVAAEARPEVVGKALQAVCDLAVDGLTLGTSGHHTLRRISENLAALRTPYPADVTADPDEWAPL